MKLSTRDGRTVIVNTILIEDLVQQMPEAVTYLMRNGIKCLACGEAVWGTLELAAKEKGFSDQEITIFVHDLNEIQKQLKTHE
jgi:hypothetical protein